ncbi:zinc-binding dehydrogenase [Microbacterium sp. 2MCAF23]|uniref:zinc-binding dehydrogenase n=1 Tax=Microbacterium sp. 2MCAF23 TaxID=3232985 RepID=UPI003F9AFF49
MHETMRAIRLTGPVDFDGLTVSEVPIPEVRPGWVRIRVMAFGVNESEVTSRKGESSADFSYPRILGIEGVGIVDAVADSSPLKVGQQVATMMGGMGRAIDGSYAEYTLVRDENVIPFTSDLPWGVLGALPEMFQTAYGSLRTGLRLEPGQSVLIRGGTSTVGLSAIALAHELGAHVIATTRSAARADLLRQHGADLVLVDDGSLADQVRKTRPEGLDAALELVGLDVLPDTLRTLRGGGVGCFTGALSGVWTLENFSPFALIPNGVRLTRYAGQASDLPADAFAAQLEAIAAGRISPAIAGTYHGLASVAVAQRALESGHTPGKHVVTLD